MSINNNGSVEKVLSRALELREEGKPLSEILSLFPECRKELEEMFGVIDAVGKQKNDLIPSEELLANIIARVELPEGVTKRALKRYTYRGAEKSRPSILQWLDVTMFSDMSKKLYIGFGVAAVVLLVIVGVSTQPQKVAISPFELAVSHEGESLSQDIAELEDFFQDVSLDTLDRDLADISGE